MEKLLKVEVEMTAAQLGYLEKLAYFMRAKPSELLVALGFGVIDTLDSMQNERCDALSRDLLNYVVERRVPNASAELMHHGDSGRFTCNDRKAKRVRISGGEGGGA